MKTSNAERASTMICTTIAGKTFYVYNSFFGFDNKRKYTITEDAAKARLYYEEDANDLISKLPKDRKLFTETFQPAIV